MILDIKIIKVQVFLLQIEKSGAVGDDDIYSFKELIPLDLDKIIQIITGKIKDQTTNLPIANAKITLIGPDQSETTVYSDQNGDYKFENVLGNTKYQFLVSADRYKPGSDFIETTKLKYGTVNKDLTLEAAECLQKVTGTILDNTTKKPLANVAVNLYDTSNNLVRSAKTDAEGKYVVMAPCNKRLLIKAGLNDSEDPYYAEYQEYFETDNEWGKTHDKNINLIQVDSRGLISDKNGNILIPTKPIYFAYNSAKVEEVSFVELDKVYNLLIEHPKWKLIIESHSDMRGTDTYNLQLSNKRAESTKIYLVNKGIPASRIIAKGFGESKPLIDCITKECSEEEHGINRRSDFVIK